MNLTNFSLLLFLATVLTGIAWLIDRFALRGKRRAASAKALNEFDRQQQLQNRSLSDPKVAEERQGIQATLERQPWWLEYTAGIFPVLFLVFFLRSFLIEPFKIPSGSMLPTLWVGDLIVVNKFSYGVRLPLVHTKIMNTGQPQRGDVMVFRFPKDTSVDYIKRVVGVPGDTVTWQNQRLTINGQEVVLQPQPAFYDTEQFRYYDQYLETLGKTTHKLLTDLKKPSFITGVESFPFSENCRYFAEGVTCKVPSGHYFMMGDNRDNSLDSRFWGFVPEQNIVGKAVFIWMNFSDWRRIGTFQ